VSLDSVLKVAICQFPVSDDVRQNSAHIRRQLSTASELGADIAHFPECALTGYPGCKAYVWRGFDWDIVREESEAVAQSASRLGMWVVLGSAHPLSDNRPPHNSLYIIDPDGRIVDRYDKRFLTREDFSFFTPGDHPTIFTVRDVRCGALVCYEKWFPELYRDYKRRGVQCLFDSIHSQQRDFTLNTDKTCIDDAERALWIAHARLNHMWISVSNHCRPEQDNTSFLVDPDGRLSKLPFKRTYVAVFPVDTGREIWDPSAPFRDLALSGALHNGETVRDPRSTDRTSF
jgi:predicted amidohydrolase